MTSPKNPQNFGFGPRIAGFLRQAYPRHHAKRIARDFDVSRQTAERWLAGHAPTVSHIEQMAFHFGHPFTASLFVEAFEAQDLRISELEAALQLEKDQRVAKLEAVLQRDRGQPDGMLAGALYSKRECAVRERDVPRLLRALLNEISPAVELWSNPKAAGLWGWFAHLLQRCDERITEVVIR